MDGKVGMSKEVQMDESNEKPRCPRCFDRMDVNADGITAQHCQRKWWLWRGTWRPDDQPAETVFERLEKAEEQAA